MSWLKWILENELSPFLWGALGLMMIIILIGF